MLEKMTQVAPVPLTDPNASAQGIDCGENDVDQSEVVLETVEDLNMLLDHNLARNLRRKTNTICRPFLSRDVFT